MNAAETPARVSIHGGHSGQFCNHAGDSLDEVVRAYIDQRFTWVGITEHMPPLSDRFLYPEEIQHGLDAGKMYRRFESYVSTCRRLQQRYRSQIQLFVCCELEYYAGNLFF